MTGFVGGGEKSTERITKVEEHNLIVALRIRPLTDDEVLEGAIPIAHKVDSNGVGKLKLSALMVTLMDPIDEHEDILRMKRARDKQFIFDIAIDGSATQQETYDQTSKFLIPNIMNGFNATVFAYGATGAGKTHTMLGTDTNPGIMARALNDLFLEMERTKDTQKYEVTMSYLEIYNEMIRDLLRPSSGYLELREDSKGVQVSGLSSVSASSTHEVMEILSLGNRQRMQEPTAANKTSSRSHAILRISVRQQSRLPLARPPPPPEGATRGLGAGAPRGSVRLGRLFLVDLAGSERAASTQNRGQRMIEGAHINRSLLALGNCINALSERNGDRNGTRYVNYRDSKLTRLLKDALGGNCKTVMIAHISPAGRHYEESRNTLAYAHRAKNIRNKVRCNVLDVSYHIAQYTNIISELQTEIKRLRTKLDERAQVDHNPSAIYSIQSEVMEAARRDDETTLNKLKQQLLSSFKHQMTIRRSLMELDSTVMAIDLESSRNELLVKTWDTEKELRQKNAADDDNMDWEGEKESLAEAQDEPDKVRAARDELGALCRQKEELEARQVGLLSGLEDAREKTTQIEQMLPLSSMRSSQRELISLLRRVHDLETENLASQTDRLSRRLQLRRRDLALAAYRRHLGLCDEIIRQQRALLHDEEPQELRQLYAVYKQRMDDCGETGAFLPDIHAFKSTSLSTMSHCLLDADDADCAAGGGSVDEVFTVAGAGGRESKDAPGGRVGSPLRLPQLAGSTSLCSLVARKHVLQKSSAKLAGIAGVELLNERGFADGAGSSSPPPLLTSHAARPRSIVTLSTPHSSGDEASLSPAASDAAPPRRPPPHAAPPRKDEILGDTRSIAQLAARRRHSKAQLDSLNAKRSLVTLGSKTDRRAERSPITMQEFLDDHSGAPVDSSLTDLRGGVGRRRRGVGQRGGARPAHRGAAKNTMKNAGPQRVGETRGHVAANNNSPEMKSRSRTRLPAPTPHRQTRKNTQPSRPGQNNKTERAAAPSIPGYRQDNITVKGLGLHR